MDPLNALGPGLEVVKCACCPIARRINYLRNLQKNMDILTHKNQKLIALETDLKRKLDKAKFQKKMPTAQGTLLLENVFEMKNKVSVITTSLEERGRFFFNCCSHLSLAKDVIKITQEVDTLLGEICQFTNELVVDQSLPKALELEAPPLVRKSTVEKNLDEILNSLRDPMIYKIGVYAMGGSGKTTTMKNINNQFAKTQDFDRIIWVTVSGDYNLERVQNDIAGQLNLNLSAFPSQEHRSSELSIRLKQAKKFLIILDDVWVRIPLDKVGIPEPNVANGCKIVLTTRDLAVCRGMETHKDIRLELLSEEEAWDLFVGDQVLSGEVVNLAKDVVRECGGLPLGIITVGRAMRGEPDVRIWRQALKELRTEPSEISGMEEDVFKLLRFSYNRLRNAKVQKCFLYLAMYPEDVKVRDNRLIRCWVNENFINGGDLEEEIDEGFKILKELVDACLLEQFSEDYLFTSFDNLIINRIRMHDLLRDMAIKIMKDEGGVLVKAGWGLTKVPAGVEWNQATKISLIRNKIEALPDQLHCPHLTTLLLCNNPLSETISSCFFDQTPLLRILDLSDTGVKELPSSLSNLLNLSAFVLKGCRSLKKIPSVAKLKNLETLNLCGTGIEDLPQGMEELISLRSLNLSQTRELSFDSIPKLQVLEELRMEYSAPFFFAKKSIAHKVFGDLNQLVILTLWIRSWDDYLLVVKHTKWETLKSFCIRVSNFRDEYWLSDDFKLLPNSMFLHSVVIDANDILPSTQELHVSHCRIPRLFKLLTRLKFLSRFTIEEVETAEKSLFLGDEVRENAFTSLEYLMLRNQTFTIFWKGVVPRDCLSNLKVLRVVCCHQLRNMFVMTLLQNLKNIEGIQVQEGRSMQQIVDQGDNPSGLANTFTTTIVLPRLHTLILGDLPKLHTISHEPWVCPSLRYVEIKSCQNLKKLPFSVDTLSKLKEQKVDRGWWERLQWDDDSDPKALADLNSKLFQ